MVLSSKQCTYVIVQEVVSTRQIHSKCQVYIKSKHSRYLLFALIENLLIRALSQ